MTKHIAHETHDFIEEVQAKTCLLGRLPLFPEEEVVSQKEAIQEAFEKGQACWSSTEWLFLQVIYSIYFDAPQVIKWWLLYTSIEQKNSVLLFNYLLKIRNL